MKTRFWVTTTAVAALLVGVLAPAAVPAAVAGPGSLVSGTVWADTNRDGIRQPTEPARPGVTVQLLSSPGGAVVATTTTNANGLYVFGSAADGAYTVRVDAPGPFVFPTTATGENDFVREGQPLPGQPERGVSAAFTITGATQVTSLNAGLQPITTLSVARVAMPDGCAGSVMTGTEPFDATEGPGLDTGPSNCIVRTGDTVFQAYSVALTGLPTGASVPNVVVEFRISSPDGAVLASVSPNASGLPSECFTAAQGANPGSSRTVNPDGSITIRCNVGTLASGIAGVPISYEMTEASAIPAHASIQVHAYAAGGEAGVSQTLDGPVIEVTGRAEWDLQKSLYPTNQYHQAGPDYREIEVPGVGTLAGYVVMYQFDMRDLTDGLGGGQLDWPVTFTDVMPEFPNARILECRNTNLSDRAGRSYWTLGCPAVTEVQGADGWDLTISPNIGGNPAPDLTEGHMVMRVFIPVDDMNRSIDPAWQPGDPYATGAIAFDNVADDTENWTMRGGQPNTGENPANNVATVTGAAAPPQWDLMKNASNTITFAQRDIGGGTPVPGYDVLFSLAVIDLAGAGNIAPWLDRPVEFKDRLVSHPGAFLVECTPLGVGNGGATATPTCETGLQPADGWDMSLVPTQWGLEARRGDFWARVFIPMDAFELDPCESANPQLHVRNEAIDSDGWTAGGPENLNNGTGFEPGWDGIVATGNNVVDRTIVIPAAACGSLTGDKGFFRVAGQPPVTPAFAGLIVGSQVFATANNDRVRVPNFQLCDVFDVSVFRLTGEAWMFDRPEWPNPENYVIEYAVGPNAVDTQAGPITGGLYPIDSSSIRTAAAECRGDEDVTWAADPAAFGPDWRDSVNMVRMRPIDPAHVEVGPFAVNLQMNLEVRGIYNGGPNAGEPIPSGVRLTNVGGWPTGPTGSTWSTVAREISFAGMQLAVAKSVSPTQYVPGARPVWDLSVSIARATVGATMLNLRVVDTLPAGLHFDLACTQGLLPPGVTVSYEAQTRQVTFLAGDIPIVTAPTQVVFSPNAGSSNGRLRICTSIDTLSQPGDTYLNRVQALADNSENAPTAQATIQVIGSGQMGITKSVDKQFVASGETYTWSLEWGNTSTSITAVSPDLIDVLPWNGDGDPGSGSARNQFPSEYSGLAQLTGALAAPSYLRGGTGAVPGTWYYSTADPSTISHDPRDAANADPAAPGGRWQTAAEIADGPGFGEVTAVRFVSAQFLPVQSRVRAEIPMVSTSNDLDNVYVNRAMIYSATFPEQPLLTNEPYVLMPGFTLGDLVWIDGNGNGRFDAGEQGVPGVTVQVMDDAGEVVATRVTDGDGRWSVEALPAGAYRAHIPASMFTEGAPLADHVVRLAGSNPDENVNENADNNNTAAPDPAVTGLTSTPVTLEFVYTGGLLTGGNGPTGDNVAALGRAIIPDVFTNFTVDLALLPEPGIEIEKATNGQDADTPTGPLVTVGGPVRWTYVVTNTGGVDLTNIQVTDDRIDPASIDCDGTGTNVVAGPLAPEASFTCVATGTATEGQYQNTGTVTGLDPTAVEVTDDDPSHYLGVAPAVDIEKATNGQDADTPTGPLVAAGGDVRWTYVVTNTGTVPLTDVTITDDQVAADEIDCDGTGSNVVPGPLAVGASFTCVATGTATLGQYANMGSVVATGPETTDVDGNPVAGALVDDGDPSHYLGVQPAVDIEKATNGQDADTPTGPLVAAGGDVRWTYVVTNTGTVPLTDVTITDDQVAADEIDCDGTGSNVVPGPLAVGGSFTCVAEGDAVAGQYANLGTVVATGPETTDVDGEPVAGQQVSDEDPSHYFGVVPAVDIEKATNGQDSDIPTGPFVTVGGAVRWTYVVTNTGNVPLTNIVVTDDMVDESAILCLGSGTNVVPGPLAPGASVNCAALGIATAGQYANLGAVTAVGPETTDVNGDPVPGVTVDDDDPSHYFGATPAVDIEKATNTQDADEPTGPLVGSDGAVRWTYVVTNTGNVPLTDVTVTDDRIAASEIDCGGTGSNVIPGPLAAGGTFTCVAEGVATVGQYANLGSVIGTGPVTTDVNGAPVAGVQVTDGDPSHYLGIAPAIDIEKSTNGEDADEPTGPFVPVGGAVEWTYTVTNTGDVPLTNVTVTDDRIAASEIDCDGTGSNVIPGPLAPEASFSCVASGTAVAGQYANLGTVTGAGPTTTGVDGETVEGEQVTDEDWSHYFGAAPAIDLEKFTNGQDADAAPGVQLTVGAVVEWTYVVTNTGNLPLTNVTVTDDKVAASEIWCGDTESNVIAGPLAPGESFTCNAFGVATVGSYVNVGTVTADVPALQTTVADDDPSHYTASTPPVVSAGPPPATAGLPATGGSIPVVAIVGGALLALVGLLIVAATRRRRA